MKKLVKIAFANVIKNGKRSLLIGTAIFVSCSLLLISGAFGNGTAAAITNEYYYQQAGDVVLLWENALKIEKDSPSRIYLSQFDPQKVVENKKALARVAEFLRLHESEINNAFPVVRRSAMVVTAEDMIDVNIYGLSSDEWRFLEPRKTVNLEEGAFEAASDSSVIISRLIADAAHLGVGDWIDRKSVV
jgi:ABC-type lipoprotein release transport system permease subunit